MDIQNIILLINIGLITLTIFAGLFLWLAIWILWIESREGLQLTVERVIIIALIFIGLLYLTASQFGFVPDPYSIIQRQNQPSTPSPISTEEIESLQNEKIRLEQELMAVEVKLNELNASNSETNTSDDDSPSRPPPVETPENIVGNKVVLLLVSMLMFLAGFSTLVLLGDSRILFGGLRNPFQRKSDKLRQGREEAEGKLLQLAKQVNEESYFTAFQQADEINERRLKPLSRIDFIYLKCFSAIQILFSSMFTSETTTFEIPTLTYEDKRDLIEQVIFDLTVLLELAPRMGEGQYLLAFAYLLDEQYKQALTNFREAEKRLKATLDFSHMKSYCLLKLAANRITEGDMDTANQFLDEVIVLEVMTDRVPSVLVENRLLNVYNAYQDGNLVEAREGLNLIRQLKELSPEDKRLIDLTTDAFEIAIRYQEGRFAETRQIIEAFLARWVPEKLPQPDEHTADEMIFHIIDQEELIINPKFFRAFYFLQAIVSLHTISQSSRTLESQQVDHIINLLLKALQFEPRHRDVLAALGIFYFWFKPQKREKAIEWLESARILGVTNSYLAQLLQDHAESEHQRLHHLRDFLNISMNYLGDISIPAHMRTELADELGQFHDFELVMKEIEEASIDEDDKAVTIEALLYRMEYLRGFVNEMKGGAFKEQDSTLVALEAQYLSQAQALQGSFERLSEIEIEIMRKIGLMILR